MTLRELVIKYRSEHGLSQRQFAAQCGLSNGYISMIERACNPQTGEKPTPTLTALNKLAKGMCISLNELFAIVDDMDVDITSAPVCAENGDTDTAKISKQNMRLDEIDRAKVAAYIAGLLEADKYQRQK